MTDHLTSRAQRLIEEFEEGENVRHGLANVLEHLAAAFYMYCDGKYESMLGVPVSTLDELAVELTAPTLLDRALATDFTSDSTKSQISICEPEKINCPRHGIHSHIISSTIEGHKGHWCQICWLETLGESLPLISEKS